MGQYLNRASRRSVTTKNHSAFAGVFVVGISLLAHPAVGGESSNNEEYVTFSNRLSTAIESADLQECARLFNTEAYLEQLFLGLKFKYRNRQAVADEYVRGFKARHGVYAGTVNAVKGGGSYRLVIVRPDEPQQLVMRLLGADGGLDYHFLTLNPNDDSELEVVDTHTLSAGGSVFAMLRATLERYMVFEGNDGKIAPEAPDAERLTYEKRIVASIQSSVKQGKHQGTLHFYSLLPQDLQNDRYVLLMCLQSATNLALDPANNQTHVANLRSRARVRHFVDSFSRLYPDDSTVSLLTMNYHLLSGQFREALDCIERLNQTVGDDPYLLLMQAHVHAEDGNGTVAIRLAENALSQLRDLPQAYLEVASILVGQDQFGRVVEVLTELEERFEITVDETVRDAFMLEPFFESDEFKGWESRKLDEPRSREDSGPSKDSGD